MGGSKGMGKWDRKSLKAQTPKIKSKKQKVFDDWINLTSTEQSTPEDNVKTLNWKKAIKNVPISKKSLHNQSSKVKKNE